MKKNSLKLSNYLATVGVIAVGVSTANANIIYTDVNPDSVRLGNNNNVDELFAIDINNDGNDDCQLIMHNVDTVITGLTYNGINDYYFNAVWMSADTLNPNNGVMNFSSSYFSTEDKFFAQSLSTGSNIGQSGSFKGWGYLGLNSSWIFTSDYWSGSGGRGSRGEFQNKGNKFVGVRFRIDSATHYGWVRVAVDSMSYGVTLLDYAYQDCPDVLIEAGDFTDVKSNSLSLAISELETGDSPEKIEFSFNLSEIDTTVSEYRLMIVKSAQASSFTEADAKMVADSLTLNISDSVITYKDTLASTVLDTDGDPVQFGSIGYKMFALSIPDGENANSIALSSPSDEFLKESLSIEEKLEGINVSVANNILVISSISKLNASINLISLNGQNIYQVEIDENNHKINLSNYKSGIYVVNFLSKDGRTFSKKIVF